MKNFKKIYYNFGISLVGLMPLGTVLACSSNSSISKEQKDIEDVQTILSKFNDTITKNNKILPNENELKNITFALLDINNPISDDLGTKISLILHSISQKHDKITIKVLVSKNQAKASKLFTVTGFKEKIANPDEDAVNFILKAFKRKQSTNLKNCFPVWKVNAKINVDDLGIGEPNNDQNVKLSYEILAINQEEGEVYVKVYAKKGNFNESFQIIVKDFLKAQDFLAHLATKIQARDQTTFDDKIPHKVVENIFQNVKEKNEEIDPKNHLGIEPLSLQDLKIATAKYDIPGPFDDVEGTVYIEVELSIKSRRVLATNSDKEAFVKDQKILSENPQKGWLIEKLSFDVYNFKKFEK